ncbi:MAG: hypothetical protein GX594_11960, partial [Pirellulaceae bacterium]|nr:hypothetical protein [Pirellulaceae bacterium]
MHAPLVDGSEGAAAEPRRHPLAIVLVAAAAGILVDRHRPLPLGAWWAAAATGLTIWTLLELNWRLRKVRLPRCRLVAVPRWARAAVAPNLCAALAGNLALLSAVAATAGAWHHCRWNLCKDDDLGLFARRKAEPACVEAIAVERPRELPPSAESWSTLRGSR